MNKEIKWVSCKGCMEFFLPNTSKTFYCWNCAGKVIYPKDRKKK
jgi:hypothetical protein